MEETFIEEKKSQVPGRPLVSADNVTEYTTLNLGPIHPATHGIFQNVLTMDGEIVIDSEQTVAYIHREFEKIEERRPYYQINQLTYLMNYF